MDLAFSIKRKYFLNVLKVCKKLYVNNIQYYNNVPYLFIFVQNSKLCFRMYGSFKDYLEINTNIAINENVKQIDDMTCEVNNITPIILYIKNIIKIIYKLSKIKDKYIEICCINHTYYINCADKVLYSNTYDIPNNDILFPNVDVENDCIDFLFSINSLDYLNKIMSIKIRKEHYLVNSVYSIINNNDYKKYYINNYYLIRLYKIIKKLSKNKVFAYIINDEKYCFCNEDFIYYCPTILYLNSLEIK